jgi:hypothetical protein
MDEFDTIQADAPAEFQAPEADESEPGFPSCRYGPDGQSAVFQRSADVPTGWKDHPAKVPGAPDPSLLTSEKRADRSSLMKELRLIGVAFATSASSKQLEQLLIDARNKAKMEKVREARKAEKAPPKPKASKPKAKV